MECKELTTRRIAQTPVLSIERLTTSDILLHRAHHVLAFMLHIYIHSQSLDADIRIPPSITIPLFRVSARLQVPVVATYADTVLYNWDLVDPSLNASPPSLDNLRSQDLFTGTWDEQEFYLASSRIEIRGVEALQLMCASMAELLIHVNMNVDANATAAKDKHDDDQDQNDDNDNDEEKDHANANANANADANARTNEAVCRITAHLHRLAQVVREMKDVLDRVREGCDPEVFYHVVRPWFCGADSDPGGRTWVFEGTESVPEMEEAPTDLSGPSAGQSALIHALEWYLLLGSTTRT